MEAFSNSSPNSANTKEIQTELNLPYVQQCSGYESIILNNTCSLDEEKITSFVITPPENILGEPQASVINGLPGECSIEHADSFQLGYPPLQSIPSSPSKAVPDLIDVQYIEAVNDNLTKILEGFTTENPPKVLQNSTNPPVQLSTIRGALSLSSESSHPSHDNFLTLSSPAIFSNAEENNSCNIPPLNVSPLASVVESSNTGSPGTSADTVLPCTPKNEPVEMNNMRGSELRDIEETVVSAMQCSKNRKELDFSSLPILKNPLLKKGRITVLGGRLSSDNPFFKAANVLGRRLVSAQFRGFRDETDEALIRKNFLCDLRAFLAEQELRNVRLPIIGGENLDVYSLARYVMLMGGVENVVRMRAFKLVAVQLGVPKSCTSSAYVLKGAYERILCQYESTLVYGEWPEEQLPDMKSTQSNPKKSEDLSCRTIKCDKGRKEKSPDQKLIQRQCGLQKIIRKSTCTVASARKVTRSAAECGVLERISRFSDFPPLTHRYLRLLAAEESRENIISIWTNGVPRDLPFRDIINRSLDRRDKGKKAYLSSCFDCFFLEVC